MSSAAPIQAKYFYGSLFYLAENRSHFIWCFNAHIICLKIVQKLVIKQNRVHKLVAAQRIELWLQAYETRQTTKPSQPQQGNIH